MPDARTLLERESGRFTPPDDAFERLRARRDRKRRNERIVAVAIGVTVFLLAVWIAATGGPFDRSDRRPADGATPTPSPSPAPLRSAVDPLTVVRDVLVAIDPRTGETRAVEDRVFPARFGNAFGNAAWSADRRWVAFDIRGCTPKEAGAGLWVSDALGDERRLLEVPCPPDQVRVAFDGVWAWSPTAAQLAVERPEPNGDRVILLDAATGDQVDLGPVVGDLTTLAWSPDGTRIAYGSLPSGSVYVVNAQDGSSSLLAKDLGYTYGIGGSSIQWSPDGTRLLVSASDTRKSDRLYLVNEDGSNLRELPTDVHDAGVSWSADGSTIALSSFTEGPDGQRLQIWTMSPDDQSPSLIFESTEFANSYAGGGPPVWSPDGTRLAIRAARNRIDVVWLALNADGTGEPIEIGELEYRSWNGGSYFCACYG